MSTVAVVGGGRMGAGIAQVFLGIGAQVEIVESGEAAASAARERVRAGLEKARSLGKLSGVPDHLLDRLRVHPAYDGLPASADLVVEAVPEDVAVKTEVLSTVEKAVGPDAVVATNTSSLPIGELAAALERPERFVGMHFFNPVPASKLVEIVVGEQTADLTTERVRRWAEDLGKTPVTVRDSPGFATSRLGVCLGLEAIRMLEEGVADAEAIDAAMELGYRHPMGPLRSTDLVGLDVRLAVAEHLHDRLGGRFAPPRLLRDKVARGELGRKTGQGFYAWDS